MTSKTKSVTCEICNKTFTDTGQRYKPKYQLNEHKKNCFRIFKKKQRRVCKDWLNNLANDIDINRLYMYIQNPNNDLHDNDLHVFNKILSPEPISMTIRNLSPKQPSPSPSPPPSCSTASDLDEWDYQNVCYFVDNKNRVVDEYGNPIGNRFKDEFSEEYRLEFI